MSAQRGASSPQRPCPPRGLVRTCPTALAEASASSACWVITEGLLELTSTGLLISTVWRPDGACTTLLSVFKAVVMENWPGPFLPEPGPLRSAGAWVALSLAGEGTRDRLFVWGD